MGDRSKKTDIVGTIVTGVGVATLGIVVAGASYTSYWMGRINASNQAAMHDAGFLARAYQAGYRIEERKGQDLSVIVARCARSNERVPLPCDPAPRPDGLAGEALVVVP